MKPSKFLDLSFANLNTQRKLTETSWAEFQTNTRNTSIIRPYIYNSWKRCKDIGVNPSKNSTDISIKNDEIETLIQRSELYDYAMPTLRFLLDQTEGTGHLVTLSDESGRIIFLDGDHGVLRFAERMNFVPGSDWSENAIGTNAIGTSLIVGSPVQVFAAEHFCQGVHDWVCSAMPIRNPISRDIIGVIDLTGLWSHAQNHSLSLIVLASRMIENDLHQHSVQSRYQLLNLFVETVHRYLRDCIVLLDAAFRIVEANQSARKLFEMHTKKALTDLWDSRVFHEYLLKTHQGFSNDEMCEIDMEELGLHVSVRAVQQANRRIGYLLFLKPLDRKRITDSVAPTGTWSTIVGSSSALKTVVSKCDIAAKTDVPIILLGESGTGKELFAKSIHESSLRRAKPFIPVNCGAIPRELLAAELFGYESGSFTGASKNGKKGKFEEAQGGTIFLDEIGEMPIEFQVFLLRVLQEREVVRIGSALPIPIDVRVIAATNRNLKEQVRLGTFRSDLYYRLNVVSVTLPPLRERRDDIFSLIQHYLISLSNAQNVPVPGIDPSVQQFLVYEYGWPGNVRELKNVLEYAILFCKSGVISWTDIPSYLKASLDFDVSDEKHDVKTQHENGLSILLTGDSTGRKRVDFDERSELVTLLERVNWNVSEVSRQLGVARTTIYRRLHKMGLVK